jgi:hypothetical protein
MMEKRGFFCKNVLEEGGQDANASIADWMICFLEKEPMKNLPIRPRSHKVVLNFFLNVFIVV